MNRSQLLFLPAVLFAGILAGCRATECSVAKEPSGSFRLSNGLLSCRVFPEATGAVGCFLPSGGTRPMGAPPSVTVECDPDGLLPPQQTQTPGGGRPALFRVPMRSQEFTAVPLRTAELSALEMYNDFFQARPIELRRRVELARGEEIIRVSNFLRNRTRTPQRVSFWESAAPSICANAPDTVVVPVRGGSGIAEGTRLKEFPCDTLWIKDARRDPTAIQLRPAENWIARISRTPAATLVLRAPDGVGTKGLMYIWAAPALGIQTQELLFAETVLAPDEEHLCRTDYLVFPGLDQISALAGDVAIHAEYGTDDLTIRLAAARSIDAGELRLGGVSVPVGRLAPGTVRTIRLPVRITPPAAGILSGAGEFRLYPESR